MSTKTQHIMKIPPFIGQERLHEEHLTTSAKSLRLEVELAALQSMQTQHIKRNSQKGLNQSRVFEGNINQFKI